MSAESKLSEISSSTSPDVVQGLRKAMRRMAASVVVVSAAAGRHALCHIRLRSDVLVHRSALIARLRERGCVDFSRTDGA